MIKKENKIESNRIKKLAKFHGKRERGDVARNLQTSYRFSALGIKPGESQTSKFPLMALFTQQTSIFGFVCSTKQKGLGTNLVRGTFEHVDVASIHLAIQFWVFTALCKKLGGH